MPVNDDLGIRMKTFYEQIPKSRLMRRVPVAIRVDGKAFHTFCRSFKKPFDGVLIKTMQETMKYLCENIQGCVLGYTQSDEITLILVDYKRLNSNAWFDYEIQKMCSISASMATMAFNRFFEFSSLTERVKDSVECSELGAAYTKALSKGAMFDARCFNIPKEEVTNLIYWRQLDATRNSIQMVGQANFSHRELQNKSCNDIRDMLMTQKGINWSDLPIYQKRGSCCIKEEYFISENDLPENHRNNLVPRTMDPEEDEYGVWRSRWIIDKNIPIFKGEGREYIDKLIYVGE